MASILSAGTTTSTSLNFSADTSGVLQLASNNGTTAVTIDTSQNVGIGAAPSTWSGYNALELTNGASSGSIAKWGGGLNFGMANNAYYTTASGWLYKSTNNTALYQQETAGVHMWYSAPSGTAGTAITWTPILQAAKDKTIALQGASSYSGTGISFPATQSASSDPNTLDDYEEGTWTPNFGGTTPTYSSQYGYYTKIGNTVNAWFDVSVTSIGNGDGSVLRGLPFSNGVSIPSAGIITYYSGVNIAVYSMGCYIVGNVAYFYFVGNNSAAAVTGNNGSIFMVNGSRVVGMVTYRTA